MSKQKIPRRLAGVKLPGELRRSLRDLAGSPDGKAAIGDALAALGIALATNPERPAKANGGAGKASRVRRAPEPAAAA